MVAALDADGADPRLEDIKGISGDQGRWQGIPQDNGSWEKGVLIASNSA